MEMGEGTPIGPNDDVLREQASSHEERNRMGFRRDLEILLNRYGRENGSNTPDYMLAEYLIACLDTLNRAVTQREDWYGHRHVPGQNISR